MTTPRRTAPWRFARSADVGRNRIAFDLKLMLSSLFPQSTGGRGKTTSEPVLLRDEIVPGRNRHRAAVVVRLTVAVFDGQRNADGRWGADRCNAVRGHIAAVPLRLPAGAVKELEQNAGDFAWILVGRGVAGNNQLV